MIKKGSQFHHCEICQKEFKLNFKENCYFIMYGNNSNNPTREQLIYCDKCFEKQNPKIALKIANAQKTDCEKCFICDKKIDKWDYVYYGTDSLKRCILVANGTVEGQTTFFKTPFNYGIRYCYKCFTPWTGIKINLNGI